MTVQLSGEQETRDMSSYSKTVLNSEEVGRD